MPPVDSFWLKANLDDAEKHVFTLLTLEAKESSIQIAEQFIHVAAKISSPPLPYCFLVAKDLSSIEPFQVHYPIHQMWNAYSPFISIDSTEILALDQLSKILSKEKEV